MEKKQKCRTYFRIVGDFEPQEIIDALGIKPSKVNCKGEKYKILNKVKVLEFSSIEIGNNEAYNVEVDLMIEKTIKELRTKVLELKELKLKYPEIEYTLEVVPEITISDHQPYPYLSPTKEIMKFLVEIDAEYDIDYYIYEKEYYWSGRVIYEIFINDKHVGYEDVIQIIKEESDDPLLKLEEIAKEKEASYVNVNGEKIDIKLFKVNNVYAIHNQNSSKSYEVYANTMPATEEELQQYLHISYNLDEDETREAIIVEGTRTDLKRRWFNRFNNMSLWRLK